MKHITLLLLLVSPVVQANSPQFLPGEFFIKMKPGRIFQKLDVFAQSQELFPGTFWVKVKHPQEASILNLASLIDSDDIEYVERNFRSKKRQLMERSLRPLSDPKESKQYSIKVASIGGMSVEKYHDQFDSVTRNDVIVAVVDTGVDYRHEDLKNKMWVNQGEIAGNGIDDDANGYVDDIYGINTLVRDKNGNATADVMDTYDHGTHVAGIIAAERDNGKGIKGVAKAARIMAIRTVPDSGDETDRNVVEAFIYAAKNGAKIINCSFGKDKNEGGLVVQDAIDYIGTTYGVLVVAAAGNSFNDIDKEPAYPASFNNDNLFVIAATNKYRQRAYFSNYGEVGVDVGAPGEDIYSTVRNNRYESFSGTSMASPNAAGVAAELLSVWPTLKPHELKEAIMNTANPSQEFDFWFVVKGWVDLLGAANLLNKLILK